MNIYTTNKCIHVKLYHLKKDFIAFSWLFLYPYRGYGPKPVKRGCVILQMEKTGPPDLVFQRMLANEIPSDR